ncbi:hypothetical protein L7F22_012286 [Adiantum nelumboides]|nr:hypothetical protein [Adiantum nelumboides]
MATATTATSLASSFLGAQELSNGVKSMGVSNRARVIARFGARWAKASAHEEQLCRQQRSASVVPWLQASRMVGWLSCSPTQRHFVCNVFVSASSFMGDGPCLQHGVPLPWKPGSLYWVTWQDAGKVELVEGSTYFGLPLPLSISTLVWIETLVIGYIKFQRNGELDPKKHLYPGGIFFDPLGIASNPEKKEVLKLAKIKHARLAMVGAFGFAVRVAATCKGPMDNWAIHLSDPLHTTIIVTFTKLEGLSMHLSNFWSGLALGDIHVLCCVASPFGIITQFGYSFGHLHTDSTKILIV